MRTEIVKINPEKPYLSEIKKAADIIRQGGLVAFPTETVYGLGANALEPKAVRKIFEAKNRPVDNPLIIHIADKEQIYTLAEKLPKEAERLINLFWPGPLTLILKKSKIVPDITTAGLDSVAVRMPSNKIALTLIKESRTPIAAPSANSSGKPSPTSAEHVIHDLYGKIPFIIDGGSTEIGVESSVIDLTTSPATLLRPGKISYEDLRRVLGKINIHRCIVKRRKTGKVVALSPGMKYAHYAPDAKLVVVEGESDNVRKKIPQIIDEYKKEEKIVGVMTINKNIYYNKADTIKFVGDNHDEIAKNLFKVFREFDKEKVDIIIAEGVCDKGMGLAIMNRLRRASHKIIDA